MASNVNEFYREKLPSLTATDMFALVEIEKYKFMNFEE